MLIFTFPTGPFQTNAYLVADETSKEALLIDPGVGSFSLISPFLAKKGLHLHQILLTHSHWDHIAEASQFAVPVLVHPLDAPNLENPGSDKLPCWVEIKGVKPARLLEEGMEIELGSYRFRVIHTPGHTPGGVCFYNESEGVLFSGDTLFKGTIGNLTFSTGEPEKMWPSLDKLKALPPKTRVYPGHGPTTTIGEEAWLSDARRHFG